MLAFVAWKKIRHWGNKPPNFIAFNIFFFFHFKLPNWKFEALKEIEISFVAFSHCKFSIMCH